MHKFNHQNKGTTQFLK